MQFRTAIAMPTDFIGINHSSDILLAGSCFAENIGNRLSERKFNIDINPFGILYNPLSIAAMMERIMHGETFTENSPEIFQHNGKWHSILHHGDFSRNTIDELLESINGRLVKAHESIAVHSTVIITFGTAYAYTRNSDNCIAGNCHKLPGNLFTRRLLGIDEITAATAKFIERYREANPNVRFIFTVSPIRHLRDGAHDNQLSKSTLLLAVDRLEKMYPGTVFYFPAYEIVNDELRDYRFYAADMVHPSQVAVDYIWERFTECCFTEETKSLNRSIEEINRAMQHRPFDPDAPAYRKFIQNVLDKIKVLKEQHPYLDFEKEIMQCYTLSSR